MMRLTAVQLRRLAAECRAVADSFERVAEAMDEGNVMADLPYAEDSVTGQLARTLLP
jgi:hypothetical protein